MNKIIRRLYEIMLESITSQKDIAYHDQQCRRKKKIYDSITLFYFITTTVENLSDCRKYLLP